MEIDATARAASGEKTPTFVGSDAFQAILERHLTRRLDARAEAVAAAAPTPLERSSPRRSRPMSTVRPAFVVRLVIAAPSRPPRRARRVGTFFLARSV